MKLSTWDWHKLVPKAMHMNALFRTYILRAAASNVIQKALLEVCANDILFWINTFGYQSNPDEVEEGPFICYPFQEAFFLGGTEEIGGIETRQWGILECIADREDLRVPKSRYVGATWMVAFAAVWLCLFHKHTKVLIMSKDEDTAEDVDDPKSLFWKIQYILDHLPDWMRRGSGKKKAGVMKFATGATITSTAKVKSGGVGDRVTLMVLDEFGQFDQKAYEIFSMTRDTARSRVFVFTHKGRDTMAFALCTDLRYADMRETVLHWSMHPKRAQGKYRFDERSGQIEILDQGFIYAPEWNFTMDPGPTGGPFPGIRSPWYDKRSRNASEFDIAMNLDIDPAGSSVTFFDSYRIGQLKHECRDPLWRGRLLFNKETGRPERLVVDPMGKLRLWVHPLGDAELPRMSAGAGVDVSSGTGQTPSCLSVFNASTGAKVLAYEDAHMFAVDFGMLVAALLRMIQDSQGVNPLLCWETQGAGTFAKVVRERAQYRPIWIKRDEDRPGRPLDKQRRAGINATKPNQLKYLEEYRDALYNQRVTNWCSAALDETLFFVYAGNGVVYRGRNKGKVNDAESGASIHHGDIVHADALAYKMICELGFENPEKADILTTVIPDPRTSAFREWLQNQRQEEREDELVWA